MAANPKMPHYSFEQYITSLRNHDQRLEYDHGDIYAMVGSSANHAEISANMWRALDDALGEDATCRAYMVDRVVRLTPAVTVMPDVIVTCERADQGNAFFLDSPQIVHFTLASLNLTIRVSDIYRRLSIPIEKRTFMPLEIIEPADEQEDS